jgi:hypothetical protein
MKLLMMFPDDLPATLAAVRAAPSRHVVALAEAFATADPVDRLALVREVPLRPEGVKIERWEWRTPARRTEQYAILDAFFGVCRTTASAPEMFGHAAAVAYRALIEDTYLAGTDLGGEQWHELRWGLEQVIRFSTAGPRVERPADPDASVPTGGGVRDAHRRWRTGHQLFFPLVQAIVVGLRCFAAAALAADQAAAKEAMVFATDVMRASARALEFAADFAPVTYGSAVRPSMTPPGVPQALSGLMSADHHRMVVSFHELRPIVAGLDVELHDLFDRFVESVDDTYAAHQLVCSRFNGDKVVSLRMNHASDMTAAEVLEQLGQARLRMLRTS